MSTVNALRRGWPLAGLLLLGGVWGCVDSFDPDINSSLNVIVVDGSVTNLAEPQIFRLNRSLADPLTGRFQVDVIPKATLAVVVDSAQVVMAHETEAGSYELPSDFRGQVGHSYQLRFTLPDGSRYQSTQQIMPAVPPIAAVRAQFSRVVTKSGSQGAGHDVYINTQDPANQHNYYRWDWNDYEKQDWCKTCAQGVYAVYNILPDVYANGNSWFVSGTLPYENCFTPRTNTTYDPSKPTVPGGYWYYDYNCRSQCWEIIHNQNQNLFDDQYTNGGLIGDRKVAEVPYYTYQPCLVEIRQSSLTADAYRYAKLLQDQTQNNGGVADTPPTALIGNIHNLANVREAVVGHFSASAVSSIRHWLDRKDATGTPYGARDEKGQVVPGGAELFYALNARLPYPEPPPPYDGPRENPKIFIYGGPPRPPTALCIPSKSLTPSKPVGWRD